MLFRSSGTPAAEMTDQVPDEVVKERFSRLLAIQNEHSLSSNQALTGQLVEVLLEGRSEGDPTVLSGRTADNRLVNLRVADLKIIPAHLLNEAGELDGSCLEGYLSMARITKAKTFSLEGEMESLLT